METKDFFVEIAKKRQIWIGEINAETSERVVISLLFLNAQNDEKPITLCINSKGGDVGEGLIMYDSIMLSKSPTEGLVCGAANSMACVVLQGCKVRRATRHSTFLTHNIKVPIRHKMDFPTARNPYGKISIRSADENDERSQKVVVKILAERTRRTPKDIIKALNAGRVFTANEAKEFRLIDEVI